MKGSAKRQGSVSPADGGPSEAPVVRRAGGVTLRAERRPFPHASRIQRALGVSQALEARYAPEACRQRGTPAFTEGTVTYFSSNSPDLHMAAHEATHQLQHSGATNDAGMGPEGHASSVANAVASGGSAAHLVGSAGAPVPAAARNYERGTWDAARGLYRKWNPTEATLPVPHAAGVGGDIRLGELGQTLTLGGSLAYADSALIAAADKTLQERGSGIRLAAGAQQQIQAPDGTKRSLSEILVTTKTGQKLPSDCKECMLTVAGTPMGRQMHAVAKPGGARLEELNSGRLDPRRDLLLLFYIQKNLDKGGDFASLNPAQQRERIQQLQEAFALEDAATLRSEFEATAADPAGLRALGIDAARLGINEHADPGVGEAFAATPAFIGGSGAFRFHFATVIAQAGPDRVTIEAREDRNGGHPFFQTYGPATRGQTFHQEETSSSGYQGSVGGRTLPAFTLRHRTQHPDAGQFPSMATGVLLERYAESRRGTSERAQIERELGKRSVSIEVKVIAAEEGPAGDDVYLKIFLRTETESQHIAVGSSAIFEVNALKLLPWVSQYIVAVYEEDIGRDDYIGEVYWPAPFAPVGPLPIFGRGAHYELKLRG